MRRVKGWGRRVREEIAVIHIGYVRVESEEAGADRGVRLDIEAGYGHLLSMSFRTCDKWYGFSIFNRGK